MSNVSWEYVFSIGSGVLVLYLQKNNRGKVSLHLSFRLCNVTAQTLHSPELCLEDYRFGHHRGPGGFMDRGPKDVSRCVNM